MIILASLLIVSIVLNFRQWWTHPWYSYKRIQFIEQVKRQYFPHLVKPPIDWPEGYFEQERFKKK